MISKPLYKTTIVIWSTYNSEEVELDDLAIDATHGAAYCSDYTCVKVEDPAKDPDFPDTEFFGDFEEMSPASVRGHCGGMPQGCFENLNRGCSCRCEKCASPEAREKGTPIR